MKRILFVLVATIAMGMIAFLGVASAQDKGGTTTGETTKAASSPGTQVSNFAFTMVRSQAAAANNCLKGASARVVIRTVGVNQNIRFSLFGMPKNTDFTVFLLQKPNSPFGFSWYQGDIATGSTGQGSDFVRGIFSDEVFGFDPRTAPPAIPNAQVFPGDAAFDRPFKPVHTYHIGIWFADPADAAAAGCSSTVTPFDGDHVAGIQALSTRNFTDNPNNGPIRRIQ